MSGFKIDSRSFDQACVKINELARMNTLRFAQQASIEAQSALKGGAPWVDNKGNARGKLYSKASQSGSQTTIELGGSAPNYPEKSGEKSLSDYMEMLEFGNDGKYRIIYPTVDELTEQIRSQYGYAALKGAGRVRIHRDKAFMRRRTKRHRSRKG